MPKDRQPSTPAAAAVYRGPGPSAEGFAKLVLRFCTVLISAVPGDSCHHPCFSAQGLADRHH